MRDALDVLRLLVKHDFLNRRMHLSAACPVVMAHPSWNPICNCGRAELWEDIKRLTAEDKPDGR